MIDVVGMPYVTNAVIVDVEDDVEVYVMRKPESKLTNKQIADIQVIVYVMVM
jgi:hypothetical protein